LLRTATKRKFDDDATETPLMFDSNLDFWEFLYEKELAKGNDPGDSWHISRKIKTFDDDKNLHGIQY
jgi:hypothetical protein